MATLDTYFDEIYCINLDRRSDRKKNFKRNYKNLGTNKITFFSAIDGGDIKDADWQFSKGALGCRLSHLAIYKAALHKNRNRILVLEDDVIIKKTFIESLELLIKTVGDDYDMIYFGGYHFIEPLVVRNNILRLQNTLALHAVVINHRCLNQLIEKIETDKRSVDSVIADLHPTLKVYGFKNQAAVQRKGFSDILNVNVDYSGSFLGKIYLKIHQFINRIF